MRSAAIAIATASLLGIATKAHSQSRWSDEYRGRRVLSSTERSHGAARLAQAEATRDRGDLAAADALYRRAWDDESLRAEAAAGLHDLHRDPAFRLPVNESNIRETRALLGPQFVRHETAHFIVLSDCGPEWTRARGDLLEQTRNTFFRVVSKMGLPAYPPREKLVCVLFNDHKAYRAFAQANDGLAAGWVAGYYATLSNRVVFYNDATSPSTAAARSRLKTFEERLKETRERAARADQQRESDLAQRLHASADDMNKQIERQRAELGKHAAACSTAKTIHEAIHLLAFNTGVQLPDRDYPFWLSEGLATSFETEDAAQAFGPDRNSGTEMRREEFRKLCRSGKLLALGELVSLAEVPGWDGETAESMYSLGHALFSHLYRTSPRELGAYIAAITAEPAGHLGRERQVELFTRYFGDLGTLERRLIRSGR